MTTNDQHDLSEALGKAWSDFEEARNDKERAKVSAQLKAWLKRLDECERKTWREQQRQMAARPEASV